MLYVASGIGWGLKISILYKYCFMPIIIEKAYGICHSLLELFTPIKHILYLKSAYLDSVKP
jgi:hypothetical protein